MTHYWSENLRAMQNISIFNCEREKKKKNNEINSQKKYYTNGIK